MKPMNLSCSGRRRLFQVGCLLLSLCLLLSACRKAGETGPAETAETAATVLESAAAVNEPIRETTVWDAAFEGGNGFMEEISLRPTEYAGFTIGFMPGEETPYFEGKEPVRTAESGMCFYDMPELMAERTFCNPKSMMYNAGQSSYSAERITPYPLTVGPDGTILWFGYMPYDAELRYFTYFAFLQRGRELLIISTAGSRGIPDGEGYLRSSVSRIIDNTRSRFGNFEWSPDSRYVFLNNTEIWQNGTCELPYIMDAHTGEVFLLYSAPDLTQRRSSTPRFLTQGPSDQDEPRFCTALDGHFSRDGRYLYLILEGNLPDWESEKVLMRWNLEAETMETCCGLDSGAQFLAEMAGRQWLVSGYSGSWQIVTAGDSGFTVVPVQQAAPAAFQMYTGLSGPAVLMVLQYRGYRCMFSVIRNPSEPVSEYYMLTDPDGSLQAVSAGNVSSPEWFESLQPAVQLNAAVPVRNTPYVLLSVSGSADQALWTPVSETHQKIMLLNTETMEIKPLRNTTDILSGGHDATASGDMLTGSKTAYQLIPDSSDSNGSDVKSARWKKAYRRDAKAQKTVGVSRMSVTYDYEVLPSDPDTLSLKSSGFRLPEHLMAQNAFEVLDDRYQLTVRLSVSDAENGSAAYSFHAGRSDILWSETAAVSLCFLADRLGSAVYQRYFAARHRMSDGEPEPVETLALAGRYEFEEIPYQVTLDSMQEEGAALTLTFSVVPEDEWGMFPKAGASGDET